MNASAHMARKIQAAQMLRALPIAARAHVALGASAKILVLRKMASEHATVVAFALSGQEGVPRTGFVVDPRDRDEQHGLFLRLGRALKGHFDQCISIGEIPQLIVPSPSHAQLLEFVARRMCRADRGAGADAADAEEIAELGNLIAYWGERRPVAGQQALVVATEQLCEHWAFGQDESRNQHLGSLLCWMDGARPDEDTDGFHQRLTQEERTHSTAATALPEFDERLMRDFDACMAARATGDRRAEAKLADRMRREQLDELYRILDQTKAAAGHLRRLPAMNLLRSFVELEKSEAERHARHVQSGGRVSFVDVDVRAATERLSLRECASEAWEKAMLYGDPVLLRLARHDGALFTGKVVDVQEIVDGRRRVQRITIAGAGARFALRVGDRALCIPFDQLRCRIHRARQLENGWEICIEVIRRSGPDRTLPACGEEVTVGPDCPDVAEEMASVRKRVGAWRNAEDRLPQQPSEQSPPMPFPDDPIAALVGSLG